MSEREEVAKALYAIRDDPYDDNDWEDANDKELYYCQADASIKALLAAGYRKTPEAEWEYEAGWTEPSGHITTSDHPTDHRDEALDVVVDLLSDVGSYDEPDGHLGKPMLVRRVKAGPWMPVEAEGS